MRPSGSETPNLAGQLLVAHPNLRDPNFRKAVLFLSAHDGQEGAHGLVLNRPTNKSLTDFLPDHDELDALGEIPVFFGGPVGVQELTIVSFDWVAGEAKITFHSQVSLDQVQILAGSGSKLIRAFVGYAGWAGGQLESELQQSAWIVHPATESILSTATSNQTWLDLMKDLGPAYHLLAIAPDDPSLN